VNEYYGKHGELPTLHDAQQYTGPVCKDTWLLEDNTGSIKLSNAPATLPWHVVDGVVALVHVRIAHAGEYEAVSFTWLGALYRRPHSTLRTEPLCTPVTVHYEAGAPLQAGDGVHVVLGAYEGALPSSGKVVHVPEDCGTMVPYSHRALQVQWRGSTHDVTVLPNPCAFALDDGRVCMVVPHVVVDAWRRWLPEDRQDVGNVVEAMCTHRHVVPMAPQHVCIPPLTQDAFILEQLPDIMVVGSEEHAVTTAHHVQVISCARGASVRFDE
jgi:hypothetical protein